MSDLEKRIENLEQKIQPGEQVILIICYQGDQTKYTREQEERAIAEFKAKRPDFKEGDFITLYWQDGQFQNEGPVPRPEYANKREGKVAQPSSGDVGVGVNFTIGKGYDK